MVSACSDPPAKLWDARTGKLLGSLDGRAAGVLEASFSPDGTRVMTAGEHGRIEIWDVHLEARQRDAIQRLVGARAPWMLSAGRLVPVPAGFRQRP